MGRLRTVVGTFGAAGAGELQRSIGLRRTQNSQPVDLAQARARSVRRSFEQLGPFWVKMGQMLASRPDIVSEAMVREFEHLHEAVDVRPFAEFRPVLEESLGASWEKYFGHIDVEAPVGAASLAQVYTATMRDGTPVVVKVQRPGVEQVVLDDIAMMSKATKLLRRIAPEFNDILEIDAMADGLFSAMKPEIDFRLEADNMEEFRPIVKPYSHLEIPKVVYATKQVIIQSRAPGRSIRHAQQDDFDEDQRRKIANQLLACTYRSMLIDGFFHADLHPGNIFVAPDEPAYIIDFGMMGRLDRTVSSTIVKMMIAMGTGDGVGAGRALIEMGRLTHRADVKGFMGDMQRILPATVGGTLGNTDMGTQMGQLIAACRGRGIAPPSSIALLGKAMSNIQGSVAFLAPELDNQVIIADVFGGILKETVRQQYQGSQVMTQAMATMELQRMLPDAVRTILDNLANGQLSVRTVGDTPTFSQSDSRAADRSRANRRLVAALAAAYLWDQKRTRRGDR
jgi:ubiquinone biosynthesis protein